MTQTAEQIRPTAPQLGASSTYVNTTSAAPGTASRTAWAGVGNGVLVFNAEGATSVATMSARDYQFTQWDPTAATDLQALLDVFDTNHDGRISAGDANFAKFMVAVTNADGTSTLASLASLGISAINLTQNAETTRFADGSSIDGTLTYTRADGSTGQAATVTFANDNANAVIQTTTTRNADGSTTLTTTTYLPDGTRSGALTTTTSAPDAFGGSTRTLATDSTGNDSGRRSNWLDTAASRHISAPGSIVLNFGPGFSVNSPRITGHFGHLRRAARLREKLFVKILRHPERARQKLRRRPRRHLSADLSIASSRPYIGVSRCRLFK